MRLAFVEAGNDWRSLNKLRVADGVLQDFRLVPGRDWNGGVLGVHDWNDTSGTVTGRGEPTCGAFSVADPRIDGHERSVQHGVRRWEDPSVVVTGKMFIGGGPHAVADPRYDQARNDRLGVRGWDDTGHAVGGESLPSNGAHAVADPRPYAAEKWAEGRRGLGVLPWGAPAGTVTSSGGPNQGAYSIADPRVDGVRFNHVFRIVPWDAAAPAVTSANGGTGSSVCDPRPAQGGWAGKGKYLVVPFDGPANTVIGGSTTGNGAFAVSDPRPVATRDGKDAYKTSGEYGVVPWTEPSGGVTAAASHDNGRWSVADPRGHVNPNNDTMCPLPAAKDRLVAVIRAIDGTYHRPFTTLELAALQSLVDPDEILQLHGTSDSAYRERIGNAVPPDAAAAIASVMGTTLLLAWAGETFQLSASPIWVRPLVIALSVHSEARQ